MSLRAPLLLLGLCAAGLASAAEPDASTTAAPAPELAERPMDTLTLDVGSLALLNRTSLQFERALSDVAAGYVGLGVVLGNVKRPFDGVLEGMWGFELSMGFRFYFQRRAPQGVFFGPIGNVAYTFAAGTTNARNGYGFQVGVMAGYQFNFSGFELSLGVGGAYHHEYLQTGATGTSTPDPETLPVLPSARVAIGWGF